MEWIRDNSWVVWLALALLLVVAEMVSLDLILLMLAVGALAGMVSGIVGITGIFQVLVAALTALAMLLLVRPSLVKRLHGGANLQVGHERLVGKQALVTEDISTVANGRVKLEGELWTAQPLDGFRLIPAGASVKIVEIRGAIAVVEPIDNP